MKTHAHPSWRRLTGWRRIANAMWHAPDDPQIFGLLEVDARPLVDFIRRARAADHHVTPTHLVGRAIAHALDEVPELNARIVGTHVIPRDSVDLFFITAAPSARDLTGVKIERADAKPVFELAAELDVRGLSMKTDGDTAFATVKAALDVLPAPLARTAIRAITWITGTRAIPISLLGLPASPFGSAMVSSVGMFGLPIGFAPIAWMYAVPLFVLVAEIQDKPVAVEGRVEVHPMLPITVTIDHRAIDGAGIARTLAAFRAYLANPSLFEPTFGDGAERPTPRTAA